MGIKIKTRRKIVSRLSNRKVRQMDHKLSVIQRKLDEHYLADELKKYRDLPVIID